MRFAPAILLLCLSAPCVAQIVTGSASGYSGPNAQTNNPVSMVFEHKQSQTLADGTHINSVTHEYFYRDSLGGTRTEHESAFPAGSGTPVRLVVVQDPVTRTRTTWQTGGPPNAIHRFRRLDESSSSPLMLALPERNQSQTPGPRSPRQVSPEARPVFTTERLGTQEVEGFRCEATRLTTTFPVGFFGNDKPLTTVSERCASKEFGRDLRYFAVDSKTGDHSTVLQSISRAEPDPSLFQPPPDYVDAKSPAR